MAKSITRDAFAGDELRRSAATLSLLSVEIVDGRLALLLALLSDFPGDEGTPLLWITLNADQQKLTLT